MALGPDIHLQDAELLKGSIKAQEDWITFIKNMQSQQMDAKH